MLVRPSHRRWMFDLVRSFSPEDWIARAEGLTEEQRSTIVKRYRRKTDGRNGLEELLAKTFAS